MASQNTGIPQLLAAEKRAAEKVAKAMKRKYLVDKLKCGSDSHQIYLGY